MDRIEKIYSCIACSWKGKSEENAKCPECGAKISIASMSLRMGCTNLSISHGRNLTILVRHYNKEIQIENADLATMIHFILTAFPNVAKEEPLADLLKTISQPQDANDIENQTTSEDDSEEIFKSSPWEDRGKPKESKRIKYTDERTGESSESLEYLMDKRRALRQKAQKKSSTEQIGEWERRPEVQDLIHLLNVDEPLTESTVSEVSESYPESGTAKPLYEMKNPIFLDERTGERSESLEYLMDKRRALRTQAQPPHYPTHEESRMVMSKMFGLNLKPRPPQPEQPSQINHPSLQGSQAPKSLLERHHDVLFENVNPENKNNPTE